MKFEHVLLGFVAMRPCTGYGLKRRLDSEAGRLIRPRSQQSQIYRTLARMTADGWVAGTVQRTPGRPDAKVYRVTPEGERELRARLTEPYVPAADFADPEFLIRYTFSAFLTPAEQRALVHTELTTRRAQSTHFPATTPDAHEPPGPPGVDPARMARILTHIHTYKGRALAAHVRWLEEVLADLGS